MFVCWWVTNDYLVCQNWLLVFRLFFIVRSVGRGLFIVCLGLLGLTFCMVVEYVMWL